MALCPAAWRSNVQRDRESANLDLEIVFQVFIQTLVLSIGSGTPLFIAEYDPFCALQAYM